jgi:hypothetical protein
MAKAGRQRNASQIERPERLLAKGVLTDQQYL